MTKQQFGTKYDWNLLQCVSLIQHNFQSSDNQISHSRLADDDKSSSPSQGSDEVRNVIMCCQVRSVKVRLFLKRNVTPCVLAVKAGKYKQHLISLHLVQAMLWYELTLFVAHLKLPASTELTWEGAAVHRLSWLTAYFSQCKSFDKAGPHRATWLYWVTLLATITFNRVYDLWADKRT